MYLFVRLVILSFIHLFVAVTANAHEGFWSKTYTIEHQLTDGESITSAEQIMLEQARLKASLDIREYQLLGKKVLLNQHKHFVPVLQAAYLNITTQTAPQIIKKQPLGKTQIFIVQQIRATLDEHDIATNILKLKDNLKLEKQLITLDNEFTNSLSNLGEIKVNLEQDNITPQFSARLIREQDQEVMMLNQTLSEVRQLFTIDNQHPEFNLTQLLKIRQNIDADIIAPILQNKVRTRISDIKELNNGEIEVKVQVGWQLPFHHMRLLGQYMRTANVTIPYGRSNYIKMSRYYNEQDRAPTVYAENIFTYLANQKIYLDISLGEQHQQLPVLYPNGGDLLNKCDNPLVNDANVEQKQAVCIVEQHFTDPFILSTPDLRNPLTFRLQPHEIKNNLSVKVQQVWQKPDQKQDKKWQRDIAQYR